MTRASQNRQKGRRGAGPAASHWLRRTAGAACLGLTSLGVPADDATRVGITAVNTYANGVKQSIRVITLIDANNPMGVALDPNTEQLKRSAVESCESNWQALTGLTISTDPAVKELAQVRISQLSQVAGDDPCHLP